MDYTLSLVLMDICVFMKDSRIQEHDVKTHYS